MYSVSTDLAAFDLDAVYRFLAEEAYWSKGLPRAVFDRALAHSICFGGFVDGAQVAFGRVITDRATFAYLADVFVLPDYRGRGYSKRLMDAVVAHPDLQGLRRMVLVTGDAHGLYGRYGFTPLAAPDRYMELHRPDAYRRG
ncbi:GNAT family N-acetyltransferase [Niveibacterium umoris]|uniref:GNAT superfamily N-acetyltransferase n=1 Tax=Niveibacterium umoris TaxID=1193620 RepID=A0A840BLW7_9RHOO|nr:GNAT family N-acetyltransferase [Niveibacterium umoris]MBB4014225.1 GNAT superfamily N-acetyltransferase [Niveibacterium umoris]